jgi:hypothetical protein
MLISVEKTLQKDVSRCTASSHEGEKERDGRARGSNRAVERHTLGI